MLPDLIQWEWFIPVLLGGAMLGFFLLRLLGSKLRKFRTTSGSIQHIEPHFARHSPAKTAAVSCRYQFEARERTYEGRAILPLTYFLRPGSAATPPVIVVDQRIQMPILVYGRQRLVGSELIEHLLLQKNETIPVRYKLRDPSRHTVIVTGDSEKSRSARNIKSSDVL